MCDCNSFSIRVEQVDDSTSYIGMAQPGTDESKPQWQIRQVTDTGDSTTILFANGNDNFLNVWDDRASLSYS